jgi:hypothetical protein
MSSGIERRLEKLEIQKNKIKLKERALKETEKRAKVKRLGKIGQLVAKAQIDHLSEDQLFGAFLQIAQEAKSPNRIEEWQKAAQDFDAPQNTTQQQLVAVKLGQDPSSETKSKMTDQGFRWNKFRKEFYGNSSPEEVHDLLGNVEYTLEVLS